MDVEGAGDAGQVRRRAFATLMGAADAARGDGSGPARLSSAARPHEADVTATVASSSSSSSASAYYAERIAGKHLQLANLDRSRKDPVAGSLAGTQLKRRETRLLKKAKQDASLLSRLSGRSGSAPGRRRLNEKNASLPPVHKNAHSRRRKRREEAQPLSRRQRKQMGLEGVDEAVTYESLLPVHFMWLEYIHQLVGLAEADAAPQGQGRAPQGNSIITHTASTSSASPPQLGLSAGNAQALASTVVKADLCGAPLRVVQSLNPALVGIEGLVARETESTFVIATRSPKTAAAAAAPGSQGAASQARKTRAPSSSSLKTVPKPSTVFALQIALPAHAVPGSKSAPAAAQGQSRQGGPGSAPASSIMPSRADAESPTAHAIEIPLYGNQLCNTLPTRATKKYKARKTIEL